MDTTLECQPSVVERTDSSLSMTSEGLGGKYLTFLLAGEEYGLEILKVREIIGILDVTKVPQTPDFVKGVVNLRGKVIPVIDLRLQFGLPQPEYNEQTCIIVVDVGIMMGIIVDTVQEVHNISARDIEPTPQISNQVNIDFLLGMGKVNDDVMILLDIEKILISIELVMLPENISAE